MSPAELAAEAAEALSEAPAVEMSDEDYAALAEDAAAAGWVCVE